MKDSTLLNASLNQFFIRYPNIKNQTSFAVAVSGGPDSMACAHVIYQLCKAQHKTLHIITVNHGLRAEAVKEAKMVEDWVAAQNDESLKHQILYWEGDKPETRVMQKARQERYALMAEYCLKHNIPTLFIAHHQGDQAETFLMRLAKGSGLDGLAGMTDLRSYDENVQIARPFLNQPKQALIDYCTQYKIGFVNDPSNENADYLRPRLRHSMKVLEQEGLTHERLSTLTRRLNRARTALEELAYQAYEKAIMSKSDNDILLNFEVLQKQQEEIYFRILSYAIADLNPSQQYNVRMDKLENLFEDIWYNFDIFKPRTLGGVVFALKDKNKVLYIKKECS